MIFNKSKFLKKLDYQYPELNVVGKDYLFFSKSNWMVSGFAVEKLSFGIRFFWVGSLRPLFDDRVFLTGPFGKHGRIEMWVNKKTKQIETAWPKY